MKPSGLQVRFRAVYLQGRRRLRQAGKAPVAPSGLSVNADGYDVTLNLSWVDQSSTETSFELWRNISGGAFNLLVTLAANTRAFEDSGVTVGITYGYKMRACNGAGCSVFSGPVYGDPNPV